MALEGGVRLVQYRDKDLPDAEFLREAREAAALCRRFGAALLVNDRVEAAREAGAHGVHLGQDDLSRGGPPHPGPGGHPRALDPQPRGGAGGPRPPPRLHQHRPMFPTATKEHARYGTLGPDLVVELACGEARSPSPPWGQHQEAPPAGPVPQGTSDRGHGDRVWAWPRIPAVRVRELLAEIRWRARPTGRGPEARVPSPLSGRPRPPSSMQRRPSRRASPYRPRAPRRRPIGSARDPGLAGAFPPRPAIPAGPRRGRFPR